MVIRPATMTDRDSVFTYAIEGMKRYPRLKPDMDKIRKGLTDVISSAKHFCYVADDEGAIKGVIIGLTGENMWAQRQFCSIPLWVSASPGAGAKLLRALVNWIVSRRAVKVAGFSPDVDLDPRVWKLAERIGFKRYGGAWLLYN